MRTEEHSISNIDVSANNLKSTVPQAQRHISLVKHLHQVLFGVEFRISVVSIWVLNGANSLNTWTIPVSMDVSVEPFCVVCSIIELI